MEVNDSFTTPLGEGMVCEIEGGVGVVEVTVGDPPVIQTIYVRVPDGAQ
jgi:hypothetical protein